MPYQGSRPSILHCHTLQLNYWNLGPLNLGRVELRSSSRVLKYLEESPEIALCQFEALDVHLTWKVSYIWKRKHSLPRFVRTLLAQRGLTNGADGGLDDEALLGSWSRVQSLTALGALNNTGHLRNSRVSLVISSESYLEP